MVYAEEGGVALAGRELPWRRDAADGDEEGDGKAQDGDLSETVETIGREGIVTHNDVNLRAGPAKRYDILLVKQKGDSVFVRHAQTGEDGAAWYCVENGEALCYVMAEFVELLPEAEAQGGAEPGGRTGVPVCCRGRRISRRNRHRRHGDAFCEYYRPGARGTDMAVADIRRRRELAEY